ncbi:sec1 family domain-containing protein 1 [Lates japonicus]|uniref:Sec1 family domain-containing protein 1 n=1 Tax=Lates japonicus TaxID=270547 RepID=A0AAD3NF85_LATJO|nr:sec1 family domain-containing protein 1 [Lates japonicus]
MAASVREKQAVALKRMLNFNSPPLKNTTAEPVWKDIISLLSVKELRDMGITLHLLLHSDRDPIPDVPAVYFVMPTEENIDRICQVRCRSSAVEALAEMVAVVKVRQGLCFMNAYSPTQRPLFVLAEIVAWTWPPLHHLDYQADPHVLIQVRTVIWFHCKSVLPGLPSEQSDDDGGGQQWSHHRRAPDQRRQGRFRDRCRQFWQKHKGSPFPEVAESVQEELDTCRAQEDEVKRLKSIMGLEGEDEGAISMLSDNTAKLTSAVSSLPELLEKKRLIDLHTNVATAVLDHIKSRKLDVYFEYEEKLMSKSTLDKSLLDIISDPDAGTPEDKMRLFLIYYITAQQAPSEKRLE